MKNQSQTRKPWRQIFAIALLAISPIAASAADYTFKVGATSQKIYIQLPDGGSSPQTATYILNGQGESSNFLATQHSAATDSYSSGKWFPVSGNGWGAIVRLDIPNAAIASGPNSVIHVTDEAGNHIFVRIDLVGYDPTASVVAANVTQVAGDATAATNFGEIVDGDATGAPVVFSTSSFTGATTYSGAVSMAAGLSINNPSGNGLVVASGNAAGATFAGFGGAPGMAIVSGSAASGNTGALMLLAQSNAHALYAAGLGSGDGIHAVGGTSGDGMEIDGGATGDDLVLTSNDWSGLSALLGFVLNDGTTTYDRATDSLQAQREHFDSVLDGAPTFAEAMDEHEYTSARAIKLDKLDGLAPSLLLSTTISASPAPTGTTFTLTDGPSDDSLYNGALIIVTDNGNPNRKALGLVKLYEGSTKTVTLVTDPGLFTFGAGDQVDIIATGAAVPLWLGANP